MTLVSETLSIRLYVYRSAQYAQSCQKIEERMKTHTHINVPRNLSTDET